MCDTDEHMIFWELPLPQNECNYYHHMKVTISHQNVALLFLVIDSTEPVLYRLKEV